MTTGHHNTSRAIPALLASLSAVFCATLCAAPMLEIRGNCMAPAIPAGAVVSVDRSVAFLDLKEGDVIKFRQGWAVYAHRVVSIRTAGNGERYVVTRGDNERATEIVTEKQYLGRVIVK